MTVERWAGNGGQMARERRKQAVQGKAGTSKKTKKLNEEALKLMDENAAGIAQLLCDSTLHGHMPSARLLVELAQRNVEAVEALMMRPGRSLAQDLAAEPEWQGEEPEAEETVSESQELEG